MHSVSLPGTAEKYTSKIGAPQGKTEEKRAKF